MSPFLLMLLILLGVCLLIARKTEVCTFVERLFSWLAHPFSSLSSFCGKSADVFWRWYLDTLCWPADLTPETLSYSRSVDVTFRIFLCIVSLAVLTGDLPLLQSATKALMHIEEPLTSLHLPLDIASAVSWLAVTMLFSVCLGEMYTHMTPAGTHVFGRMEDTEKKQFRALLWRFLTLSFVTVGLFFLWRGFVFASSAFAGDPHLNAVVLKAIGLLLQAAVITLFGVLVVASSALAAHILCICFNGPLTVLALCLCGVCQTGQWAALLLADSIGGAGVLLSLLLAIPAGFGESVWNTAASYPLAQVLHFSPVGTASVSVFDPAFEQITLKKVPAQLTEALRKARKQQTTPFQNVVIASIGDFGYSCARFIQVRCRRVHVEDGILATVLYHPARPTLTEGLLKIGKAEYILPSGMLQRYLDRHQPDQTITTILQNIAQKIDEVDEEAVHTRGYHLLFVDPEYIEQLIAPLRSLHLKRTQDTILVITQLPEPFQQQQAHIVNGFTHLEQLQQDGVLSQIISIDRHSPFATKNGPDVQLITLIAALFALVFAHKTDYNPMSFGQLFAQRKSISSCMSVSSISAKLEAQGAPIAYTVARHTPLLGPSLPSHKGYGNPEKTIEQVEALIHTVMQETGPARMTHKPLHTQDPCILVVTLPYGTGNQHFGTLANAIRKFAGNTYPTAICLVVPGPGEAEMEHRTEDILAQVSVFYPVPPQFLSQPPAIMAEINGAWQREHPHAQVPAVLVAEPLLPETQNHADDTQPPNLSLSQERDVSQPETGVRSIPSAPVSPSHLASTGEMTMNFQRYEKHLVYYVGAEHADPNAFLDDPDLELPIRVRLAEIAGEADALTRFVQKNLAVCDKFSAPQTSKDAFFLARHTFAVRAAQRARGKPEDTLLPWSPLMQALLETVQDTQLIQFVSEDHSINSAVSEVFPPALQTTATPPAALKKQQNGRPKKKAVKN